MVRKGKEGRLREGGGQTVRESGGEAFRGTETGRETPGDREREGKGGRTAGSELCRGGRGQEAEGRSQERRGGEGGEPGVMASETQLQGDELTAVGWAPDPRQEGDSRAGGGKCRGHAGAPTGPAA